MFKSDIEQLNAFGYAQISKLYSESEIELISNCLDSYFKKEGQELFAIRQLLKTIPELKSLLFTGSLKHILHANFSKEAFLTKAIYFNKPPNSNWFVSYHQDLSISVHEKIDTPSYTLWTKKKGQIGVIPPIDILDDIITIRIHLDETNENNGALKVVPSSHNKGIIRSEYFYKYTQTEKMCNALPGDVLLMKPLTLHASNKTVNNTPRRIIHLEFSTKSLHGDLKWLEKESV